MTMSPAASPSGSLVRHGPFARFFVVRIFATVALQIQAVAVGWQIYGLTGDPFDLGLVGLAQFLPAMLLFPFTGHVADRYDRRTVLRLCQAAEAAAVAALMWGTASGAIGREAILGASLVIGAARAFEAPALSALLPVIVSPELFPRAVAGSASANQFATIAGPALGGLVYALSPVAAYAFGAVLFLAASTLVGFIPLAGRPAERTGRFSLESLFAGFAFIRRQPIVLGAISLDLFAVLLGSTIALLPVFARDVLATDAAGLGILRACPAVGALAMSLALARWPLRQNVGRTMYACVALFGCATVAFAASRSLVLSMTALAILGMADLVSVVVRSTLIQLETPDAMRGRVSAVNSLFIGAANQLGDFRAGAMAALIGAVPAALFGGIGTLVIVVLWMRLFPALYGVQSMQAVRTGV
ncbi:MAG TPA: MFS transporter [Xanthobacteraceae bacterium]|nr:MFS transporter [Xanthobacteraceae bacterium]